MSQIFRVISLIVAPAVVTYISFLGLTYVIYPTLDRSIIDTSIAHETFMTSPPAYLTYSSTSFRQPGDTLVLIGPSNVEVGFPLAILQPLLPGVRVHNAAIGGARIDGMAAVVDLVYAQRDETTEGALIFVFGLWYGEFLHSERSTAASPVSQQMARLGLFYKTDIGPSAKYPASVFNFAVDVLRPFFWLNGAFQSGGPVSAWLANEDLSRENFIDEGFSCDQDFFAGIKQQESTSLSKIYRSQFLELIDAADKISTRGDHLVLVDLPHAECVTRTSERWKDYQQFKLRYIEEAQELGAQYLNLQDINESAFFLDITHPSAEGATQLSEALADAIQGYGILSEPAKHSSNP